MTAAPEPEGATRNLKRLLGVVVPYRRMASSALAVLLGLVVMDLALPRLIQRIIDEGIAKNDRAVVVNTALVMLAISALSTVLAIANNALSVRVGEGVARDLREGLFVAISRFSYGNLDRQKTGQLLVRLTSDVGAVKCLTQISLRIGTRAPLLMVGSLALMIATSPRLALTLLPVLVVTGGLITFFVVRMEPLFQRVQQRLDVLNGVLQENVAVARLVKALVRGEFESERFAAANEALSARAVTVMRVMSSMAPALTMCINVGVVVVIWAGGRAAVDSRRAVSWAGRRFYKLPAHHHDTARDDDDVVEHVGVGARLARTDGGHPRQRPGRGRCG